MKLTRAANYALRAVVQIASVQQKNKAGKKKGERKEMVASDRIADERNMPKLFLLKLLKYLVGAKILQSVKGPNGGYSLARPPSEITVLEVIEAANNEPISGNGRSEDEYQDTNPMLSKRLDQICNQLAEQTRKHLKKIRISDLLNKD